MRALRVWFGLAFTWIPQAELPFGRANVARIAYARETRL
jgi:hypothetical protein